MKVIVHRDQAVWERETLEVEIPDDTPDDELESAAREALNDDKFTEIAETRILDEVVEGIDTQISVEK